MTAKPALRAFHPLLLLATLLVAMTLILAVSRSAAALSDPEELVEKAALTIEKLLVDPNMTELRRYVEESQAVLIVPQMVKGSFIIGAEGGSGVLLVKGSDGTWSAPAFYTLAAGSIGLQIGAQVSEVVFTIMNEGAVEAILDNNFKLGADASIAVGPIGKGIEASTTTNFSDDVYAFAKAVGLYGGGSFEGAAILKRGKWNESYYATGALPQEIVLERKYFNAHADRLRGALPY